MADNVNRNIQPGDEMADGTIYAGVSPDTGKPIYTTPADAPGVYSLSEAEKYAKKLKAHGHHDFRIPSTGELNVLWENRDKGKLKNTFNETGAGSAAWYWTSQRFVHVHNLTYAQRFNDGKQGGNDMGLSSSLRLVR
jgi:Protein of unknown function (DUF1566)